MEPKTLTLEEMLELVSQNVNTCHLGKAAYTLIVGAGFSYGVIPTAREILENAPAWLYNKLSNNCSTKPVPNRIEIAKRFWGQVKTKCRNSKLEFDDNTGMPKNTCVSEAYKFLMSVDCPGGLSTPVLRREYIRNLCRNAERKNNPAHLYLACLLNQQLKSSWGSRGKFCKTVLTTNFDPLLQDALQLVNVLYYMSDQPEVLDYLQEDSHDAIHLVYTHGSIHRYILLNSEDEISLGGQNSSSLKSHFEQHGVIVIGYGGGWDDATMKALQNAKRFDGNLYWCVRKEDSEDLPSNVKQLFQKHAACAFKVLIPDADEAMNNLFEKLTGEQTPDLITDPINMIIEQMDGLSITVPNKSECTSEEEISKRDFPDSFNLQIRNSIKRLKIARETYKNPEKYDGEENRKSVNLHAKSPGMLVGMKIQAVASKYLVEANRLAKAKQVLPAIEMLSKILEIPGVPEEDKADALIHRADLYSKLDPPQFEKCVRDYTMVVKMPKVSINVKAGALINRGHTYGSLKPPKREEAISDYTTVLKIKNVGAYERALALHNRAIAFGKLIPPRLREKIVDCTTIIEMPDAPAEYRAKALCNRACNYIQLDDFDKNQAIKYFTAVIEEPCTFANCKAGALINRGLTYAGLVPPKIDQAFADFSIAFEMQDIQSGTKICALLNRSSLSIKLKIKRDEAIADCSTIIGMADATSEERAEALLMRARAYRECCPPKINKAINDISAILELDKATVHQKTEAALIRVILYLDLKPPKTKEAIKQYKKIKRVPRLPAGIIRLYDQVGELLRKRSVKLGNRQRGISNANPNAPEVKIKPAAKKPMRIKHIKQTEKKSA